MPISLRFPEDLRSRVRRYAAARGLEEATAIRTICAEHLNALELSEDLRSAEEWQLKQALETWDRFERGELELVPHEEIERIFEEARRKLKTARRR